MFINYIAQQNTKSQHSVYKNVFILQRFTAPTAHIKKSVIVVE